MKTPIEQSDGGLASASVPSDVLASTGMVLGATARSRLLDYCELAKVRLSLLVIFATAAGFCLGGEGPLGVVALLHVMFGTALVAFGANTLNQVIERDYDRLMRRTENRPIPSGRVSVTEATAFGLGTAAAGMAQLCAFTNLLAASLAGATLLLYLLAYTPLKRRTPLNTLVGAVPGAIPPLIGYAAAGGRLDAMAWILFGILFCWQLPHFFAIAWLYREDYARGGYRMLSLVDPFGIAVGRQMVLFSVLLIACSFLPCFLCDVKSAYPLGALLFGVALLWLAVRFAGRRTRPNARIMLLASIAYLPLLLTLLVATRRSAP